MNIFMENNKAKIAKFIANKFSRQLGFVNKAALEVSAKRGELEIVGEGSGFCHFHHRRDGQTTIYSIAVESSEQGKGWGRLLLFRIICSAIESGNRSIIAKCPVDELANKFYQKQGFSLKEVLPGKKRALNVWEYKISHPLLFYCGDGGTGPFGRIATEVGWLPGFRSDKSNSIIRAWFIDNHWQNYCHKNHLKIVEQHKPLLATACDVENEKDLPEIISQAKELTKFCGRVLLIPKVKFKYDLIDFPFWWGFSVPTNYGGTQVECNWFQGRPVHLLGGSPRAQAEFAKHLNIVSVDGNVATKMAQRFGKAIWQNNNGVQASGGCYEAFRMSMEEQKKWWQNRQYWKWEDEPLAQYIYS